MNKLNYEDIYENIYKLFDSFDTHTDCYPGSIFVRIYHDIPVCYNFCFTKKDKITYSKYIEKPSSKDIKHDIDDKFLVDNFIKDPDFEVVQYSAVEYLIFGCNCPFICIVELSDSDKSVSFFRNIYLSSSITDNELKKLYNKIEPYFKSVKKEDNIDFGIAAVDPSGSLYTNYYDFQKVKVNVKQNYNDDIPYDKMLEILNKEGSASLMLFYGDPGTGKSSLIKKFISEMKDKEFVFMDGTLLANVQQDRLMSYFLENQNTVFIFEDCEKILTSRDKTYNPTMSILLNLTDGIISDILNIKIICTFNTALSNIDEALLRKGRLTLKYEFKKLCKEKVRKILKDDTINEDMSLADIYNYKEENDFSKKITKKIGF